MIWNNHSRDIRNGEHAFLSPSSYAWFNYSDDKLFDVYINRLAAVRGTALHDLARQLIQLKVLLPDNHETLNMYVNDAIRMKMVPEVQLYFSKFCYGTADSITVKDGVLHIHDLKTGRTKASFMQLGIYAALFFLEYDQHFRPSNTKIELRIYQNNEVLIEKPDIDYILPIMDKIKRFSKLLTMMEENYDDRLETFRRSS